MKATYTVNGEDATPERVSAIVNNNAPHGKLYTIIGDLMAGKTKRVKNKRTGETFTIKKTS